MNKLNQSILKEGEQYVRKIFQDRKNEDLLFHNLEHTENVVRNAEIIADYCDVNGEEKDILLIAAWFHDTGYNYTVREHEERSKQIARKFLEEKKIQEQDIKKVETCIDATKHSEKPTDRTSEILCDADLHHTSQDNFIDLTLKFRKERNNISKKKTKKIDYYTETAEFLRNIHFFTAYGKKYLEPGKQKNIELLNQKIEELQKKKKKKSKTDEEDDLKITKVPSIRGIETMFRLTARNQINLSSIADNKANILISVNAIIISIVVSILVRKFDDIPQIILPTMFFILTCLVTLVISILSTRPNISSGKFTREDIKNKQVNLLFFGNFYDMDIEEYEWAIKEMLNDPDYLYGTMIKDQYYLGKVLSKKYKLLRTAYTVFMFGFVISVFVFIFALLFL
jgi:HD superfamily phosphodiesterase